MSKPEGHITRVKCRGGPHAGESFAVHSYGRKPEPVPHQIDYDSHPEGRYVLNDGVYLWETVD